VKNKTALVQKQVALPHPRKYRNVIRENLQAMAKGARPDMFGEELLADILGDSDAERMILTNANFICVPNRIFEGGDFYALAVEKLQAFGTLFQGHEIELSICMRDPEPLFQRLMANLTVGRLNASWREPPPLWCNGLA
jgi:hypothetical protein